jgi:hypothetical protein
MALIYGNPIPKARGYCVLVTTDRFRDRERVDIREWFEERIGDPDTLHPTRKGASLPLTHLPRLMAALYEVEVAAIREGHLKPAHYLEAGLDVPAVLQPRIA